MFKTLRSTKLHARCDLAAELTAHNATVATASLLAANGRQVCELFVRALVRSSSARQFARASSETSAAFLGKLAGAVFDGGPFVAKLARCHRQQRAQPMGLDGLSVASQRVPAWSRVG
jgi:hypothetical protein